MDARRVDEVREHKRIPGCFEAIGRAPIARIGIQKQTGNAENFNRKKSKWLWEAARKQQPTIQQLNPDAWLA